MKIPVFPRLLASVTALTLAAPALAQQSGSVSDFELPTAPATPQGQAQGPVAEGIPAPRVARPSPTPAPVRPPVIEAEPAPQAVVTPTPAASSAPAERTERQSAPASAATPTPGATGAATPADTAGAAPVPAASPAIGLPVSASPSAITAASAAAPAEPGAPAGGLSWWVWALALLAVGAIGLLAGWFWRGRRADAPLLVPAIERPRVPERAERTGPPADLPKVALSRRQADEPAPAPEPVPVAEDLDELAERPLRIALEPSQLRVSLLNATLAYRILLTNQGDTTLRDISIDGDMISAHASLSQDEQLAAPNSKLENRHLVRRLAPGETKMVNGEFALPLPLIRPIRRGEAALFVPLARLRIVASRDGAAGEVLVQTSVVGQRSIQPGGGLRPFRLDLGPRIYSELAQRAFA